MQVDELLQIVINDASKSYLQKHGNILPALVAATAFNSPSIARNMAERYNEGMQLLNPIPLLPLQERVAAASSPTIWQSMFHGALGGKPKGDTPKSLGYGGMGAMLVGNALGQVGTNLLKDMASKAVSAIGNIGTSSAREAIIKTLKKEDPILAQADDKELMEAYHTMVRFAPTLSTDKNAVRSFLRTAVMSGSGPDFATIRQIADAERSVTSKGKDH